MGHQDLDLEKQTLWMEKLHTR